MGCVRLGENDLGSLANFQCLLDVHDAYWLSLLDGLNAFKIMNGNIVGIECILCVCIGG